MTMVGCNNDVGLSSDTKLSLTYKGCHRDESQRQTTSFPAVVINRLAFNTPAAKVLSASIILG